MVSLDEYQKLKKQAEMMRAGRDRAQGALDQQMKKLKEAFGCDTIEQAKEKLAGMEKEEAIAEATYDANRIAFDEKWKEKLL